MASNKAPKNDFAPAWLKIPDTDSSKPSGGRPDHDSGKSNRPARRDDYYNNYGRFPVGPDYNYHPLQRQRSFDYYDERRYSPQKFRHHSVDDGYYNPGYPGPYPYYNGYEYNHYRSQPTLYRDGKYQHPNARYGNGQVPVNGVYPPYPEFYEPPYYDGGYYGDHYYNNYPPRSGGKRNQNDKHSNKSNSEKEAKDSPDGELASHKGSIEEEFPSLNGDAEPQNSSEKVKVNSHGVWEKPMSNRKPKSNSPKLKIPDGQPREAPPSKQSMAMYKALVPNKASLNRKSSKDGMKSNSSKDLCNGPSKTPGLFKSAKDGNNKTFSGREVSSPSSSAPMEILNKQLVSQPRNLADKKSQFLKTLKNDSPKPTSAKSNSSQKSNSSDSKDEKCADSDGEDAMVNGVHSLSVSHDLSLSSSLEAEQRLLREMGWNEADEEEYVITEDDMKEFQNLSKQMKEKKNGLTRTLPKSWSPQHLSIYQPSLNDLSDKLSSTSDDSDLDAD